MYKCEICNYEAKYYSNLFAHNKSKRHLNILSLKNEKSETINKKVTIVNSTVNMLPIHDNNNVNNIKNKVEKKYICKNCDFTTIHRSSFSRHSKNCIVKNDKKYNQINTNQHNNNNNNDDDLRVIVKELKIKMEFMERENKLLNNILENANSVITKTTNLANTNANISMSAIKYANDKFKNTPALLPLENFKINNLDFDNQEDKAQLVEILIYNAKQKSLDKLLGDHIVKEYKKDNPEEQTFYTTDCSRLNFIVRELIENALIWSIDKNGIKICSSIIQPLINKCISALLEYQKILLQTMGTGNFSNRKDVELIIDVIMSIDSGSLETDINRYIAPFFNLNKNSQS